jgi:hypothetical protein
LNAEFKVSINKKNKFPYTYIYLNKRMRYAKQFSLADGWSWYIVWSHLKKNSKTITLNAFLTLKKKSWKDELLKWDPLDYDGITIMRVPFAIVWTPGRRKLY